MDDDATRTSFGSGRLAGPSLPGGAADGSDPSHGRFLPGTIVAGRYRVVGQLGAGGMGEVYRADDLKLGQTVALKFLPPAFATDQRRLDAFRAEVRLAREVTHPNVCRVHDIGDVDGDLFLSMEYVDGEDLASLLRRIGRVPEDKALELARQICAGLSAAHERGVLHRDLKPANIMIDGRGRARIMDFGLAAATGTVRREDIRSGTPHYMAPEAFEGREVSARSDVYSLGLVLYELFTGKRALEAHTLAELRERHALGSVSLPSQHLADLDPAVEQAILRCIESEPAARPPSVAAVAASLPGGDPLAAALAAGETPSPELVAAAGGEGALAPRTAWGLLTLVLAALVLLAVSAPSATLLGRAPLEKTPDVLEERAREVVAATGHELQVRDSARGLELDSAYLDWIAAERGAEAVSTVVPRPVGFWYRQANAPFRPRGTLLVVSESDPPPYQPGSALVVLDSAGHLQLLHVPPAESEAPDTAATGERGPAPAAAGEPDWTPFLRFAGLDPAALAAAEPRWTPGFFADARRAWTATSPDGSGTPLRVEAASYRGRPVSFFVRGPWQRALREDPVLSGAQHIATIVGVLLMVGSILAAIVFARRNVRAGRSDRRGAARLALFTLGVGTASFLLRSQFPRTVDLAWGGVTGAVEIALFVAALIWLLYLALEPLVRRGRPQALVAWNRVLAGRWRDPLVGRDLLVGCAYGAFMLALVRLQYLLPPAIAWRMPRPQVEWLAPLVSSSLALSTLLDRVLGALLLGMLMQFFMSFGRLRVQGQRIGYAIFFLISVVMFFVGTYEQPLSLRIGYALVLGVIWTHLFARQGLVAGIAAAFFVAWRMPLILDPSSPYAWTSLLMMLALVALPVYGFRVALGERSAFGASPA